MDSPEEINSIFKSPTAKRFKVRFKTNSSILDDAWVINLRRKSKMGTLKHIFSSGASFLLLLLGIGALCHIIKFIIDLCSKKKKKQRKGSGIKCGEKITEQEYVDENFDEIRISQDVLNEEIEILKRLNLIEYEFITDYHGFYEGDKYFAGDKARKRLNEKGYSYAKSFKRNGELWVKEDKKI